MIRISRNKEDYLKIIYELGGKDEKVVNKKISEALNVSAPSVSEMINKLLKDGYIEYTSYHGVTLTELGLKKAMEIKRRHLLWEVFLVDKLGYSWKDVHKEAENLEHVTSPKLEKLLDKYLNYPKFCPHGNPIISEEEIKMEKYTSIEDMKEGDRVIVTRFRDNKETLRYAGEINLKIGDQIELINKDKKTGNIKIKKNGTEIELKLEFIKDIYVL